MTDETMPEMTQEEEFFVSVTWDLMLQGHSLDAAMAEAERRWSLFARRRDWVQGLFEEMARLHDALAEHWAAFDAHPELRDRDADAPPLPQPPEQAALDRVEALIAGVRERGEFPEHLAA